MHPTKKNSPLSKKRLARVIAVQSCYSLFFCDLKCDELKKTILDLQNISIDNYDEVLLDFLLNHCIKERNEFCKIIEKFLDKSWTLNRLDFVKIAILCCATAELKYHSEIEKAIVIHEYTSLANLFVKEAEIGFINAILQKIALYLH